MGILFNHLNFVKMKKLKLLIPMMVLVMAIGMAFASNTYEVSTGWINLNGVPTQLENQPCDNGSGNDCRVTFEDDPEGHVYTVYTDATLATPIKSSSADPYIIATMP